MSDTVLLDARVLGFSNEKKRIVGACDVKTGIVRIMKELPFVEQAKKTSQSYQTVVVTDAKDIVKDWGLAFDIREHLDEVITIYQMRERANLIHISDDLQRYNPSLVLQVRKLDKNGLEQEFDSSSVDNGHIAVLLLVWASYKAKLGLDCCTESDKQSDFDPTLVPFSFGGWSL